MSVLLHPLRFGEIEMAEVDPKGLQTLTKMVPSCLNALPR